MPPCSTAMIETLTSSSPDVKCIDESDDNNKNTSAKKLLFKPLFLKGRSSQNSADTDTTAADSYYSTDDILWRRVHVGESHTGLPGDFSALATSLQTLEARVVETIRRITDDNDDDNANNDKSSSSSRREVEGDKNTQQILAETEHTTVEKTRQSEDTDIILEEVEDEEEYIVDDESFIEESYHSCDDDHHDDSDEDEYSESTIDDLPSSQPVFHCDEEDAKQLSSKYRRLHVKEALASWLDDGSILDMSQSRAKGIAPKILTESQHAAIVRIRSTSRPEDDDEDDHDDDDNDSSSAGSSFAGDYDDHDDNDNDEESDDYFDMHIPDHKCNISPITVARGTFRRLSKETKQSLSTLTEGLELNL